MAHVAVERELAHDQHASAHIRERPVHFIIFIAEYAQTEDFFGQLAAEHGRIVRPDAEQDEKSPPDLPVQRAVNTNAGGIHAGNDCFHNGILSCVYRFESPLAKAPLPGADSPYQGEMSRRDKRGRDAVSEAD